MFLYGNNGVRIFYYVDRFMWIDRHTHTSLRKSLLMRPFIGRQAEEYY